MVERALEVTVLFKPDFTPFEKGLDDAKKKAKDAGDDVEQNFGLPISKGALKAGAGIAIVTVAAQKAIKTIIAFGKEVVAGLERASVRAREAANFNNTFSTLSNQAQQFADDFAGSFEQPIAAVKRQLEDFQAFFDASNFIGGDGNNLGLTKVVTGITGDLAAQTGKDFEKVGAVIKQSLLGNFQSLARDFNILISNDLLQREGVRLGLIEDISVELTKQQKTLLTIQQIQRQTASISGVGQDTSDQFDAQLRRFEELRSSVEKAFSNALLPAAERILGIINDNLEPFVVTLQNVASELGATFDIIADGVELFSDGEVDGAIEKLKEGFREAVGVLSEGLQLVLADFALQFKEQFPILSAGASLAGGGISATTILGEGPLGSLASGVLDYLDAVNPLTASTRALTIASDAYNDAISSGTNTDAISDLNFRLTESLEKQRAANEKIAANLAIQEAIEDDKNSLFTKQAALERQTLEIDKEILARRKKEEAAAAKLQKELERELKARERFNTRLENFDEDAIERLTNAQQDAASRISDIIQNFQNDSRFFGAATGPAETLIGQLQDREFQNAERGFKLQEDIKKANEDSAESLERLEKGLLKRRGRLIATGIR